MAHWGIAGDGEGVGVGARPPEGGPVPRVAGAQGAERNRERPKIGSGGQNCSGVKLSWHCCDLFLCVFFRGAGGGPESDKMEVPMVGARNSDPTTAC